MAFEALRQRIAHDRVVADLERSEAILTTVITNLRTLMFQLSPVDSPDQDLGQVLPELVERFQHASGIVARFISDGDLPRTSPRVSHEVTRIVQEALVNVYKHSGAQRVLVAVFGRDRHCCIMVDDDGRGFDFDGRLNDDDLERLRKGPRVIKERVRLLGGTVAIRSTPGSGSQLEIVLPRRA